LLGVLAVERLLVYQHSQGERLSSLESPQEALVQASVVEGQRSYDDGSCRIHLFKHPSPPFFFLQKVSSRSSGATHKRSCSCKCLVGSHYPRSRCSLRLGFGYGTRPGTLTADECALSGASAVRAAALFVTSLTLSTQLDSTMFSNSARLFVRPCAVASCSFTFCHVVCNVQ